ncbi:nucleic acid dioxygenase ALKBH1-like [Paramacrobiotus metropolitanus]|uniref:nucleic acid dioxygenase ALKBH1-like n=1 Tax=Paramacrobiotus metropolitanus TaxID=2943436 RepID=UPI0024458AF6|nr:nucleic acid dioxygenase ALKBH1-like [Paramacrobiotus metropolitanus]
MLNIDVEESPCQQRQRDFKAAFKVFKAAKDPVLESLAHDGVTVADPRVRNSDDNAADSQWRRRHPCIDACISDSELQEMGLIPVKDWCIRELIASPGSMVISNPFTNDGRRKWIRRCLMDFPRTSENISNLDADWKYPASRRDIDWFPVENICGSDTSNGTTKRKSAMSRPAKKRTALAKSRVQLSPIWKLRWITLGYHHDWDTKIYSDAKHTPFPADVDGLCKCLAAGLGFADFTAQAAIINYYHLDSTLSIHQDISEPCKDAPLFSVSFGQPGIFLIGPQRQEWPNAVLLRSGDVFVMSGASRLDFHAVPKIFQEAKDGLTDDVGNGWTDDVREYLSTSRINMNIRQVLRPGKTRLYEE